MRTIGCEAALVTVLVATSLWRGTEPQPGKGSDDDIKPYPGSTAFCTEHVTGAAGAHINWTGYYSVDSPEKVVGHYTKTLGSENHRKERNEDIWRFPLAKPERVLTVTRPGGAFPLGQCTPPPRSARAIMILSTMARPD